jgi:hypothetical protein
MLVELSLCLINHHAIKGYGEGIPDVGEYSASQPNCFVPKEFLAVPCTFTLHCNEQDQPQTHCG